MTVFRLNPKMSTSDPMYVKLTTSVGYTICEIKDVTVAKKTVISISDQLETLIGIEFVLEYSSHYNSSDQFVCDKLNRMKINLQKKIC
jgi:hypothetical protein